MDKPKNRLERLIATLAIGLLAVIIIPQSAGFVTFLVWPPVGGIDPTVSGWITIHHLLQLAFTVLVIKFVFRMNLRQWGFNLNKWRERCVFVLMATDKGWLIPLAFRLNETVEKYRMQFAFLFLSSIFLDFRFFSATFCSDVETVCQAMLGSGPGGWVESACFCLNTPRQSSLSSQYYAPTQTTSTES